MLLRPGIFKCDLPQNKHEWCPYYREVRSMTLQKVIMTVVMIRNTRYKTWPVLWFFLLQLSNKNSSCHIGDHSACMYNTHTIVPPSSGLSWGRGVLDYLGIRITDGNSVVQKTDKGNHHSLL